MSKKKKGTVCAHCVNRKREYNAGWYCGLTGKSTVPHDKNEADCVNFKEREKDE